jgi:hypothetical protein
MADRETPASSQPEQADVQDQRESINREKGRELDTPTSVQEQVDQLDDGTDDHARRDPLGGAADQQKDVPEGAG